jgi:hypothetical protein
MTKPKKERKQATRGPRPETLQLDDTFEVAVKKALSRGKYPKEHEVGTDKRVKKK